MATGKVPILPFTSLKAVTSERFRDPLLAPAPVSLLGRVGCGDATGPPEPHPAYHGAGRRLASRHPPDRSSRIADEEAKAYELK